MLYLFYNIGKDDMLYIIFHLSLIISVVGSKGNVPFIGKLNLGRDLFVLPP